MGKDKLSGGAESTSEWALGAHESDVGGISAVGDTVRAVGDSGGRVDEVGAGG